MSDTYNILKKYAYLNYVDDPYYGRRPEWDDTVERPENPISRNVFTVPYTGVTITTRTDTLNNLHTNIDSEHFSELGDTRTDYDEILLANLMVPSGPDHAVALGIYNKIVHGILFNKTDPVTNELRQLYPAMFSQVETSLNKVINDDPAQQQKIRTLQAMGSVGETLAGSEIDYLAQSSLYDSLYEKVSNMPTDTAKKRAARNYFKKYWLDKKGQKLQQLKDDARKRTNSYSFSNYVPGMVTAGLIPAAIGSLMGRPFLGMLLGALLSGGVGYYGYNRLNNPNYQGYEWLDKTLGYAPATRTTNQPQTDVQNPTPVSPAPAETATPQSRSLGSGTSSAQTPQQGEQINPSANELESDGVKDDEDIDTSALNLDF